MTKIDSGLPWRRSHITTDVDQFTLSVGYDPRDGRPCEVFINHRGKVGQHLDYVLYEMGVTISKILQGEITADPECENAQIAAQLQVQA